MYNLPTKGVPRLSPEVNLDWTHIYIFVIFVYVMIFQK